jgi:hypothetical protein
MINTHRLTAILVVLIVAMGGTYLILGSHADSPPYISTTADTGTLASGAATCPTTETLTGNSVVFTSPISMDGTVALGLSCLGTPFAASSFWNTPLPADTPVSTNSAAYVNEVTNQLCYGATAATSSMTGACTTGGSEYGNLNTARWSSPFYVVPADQPCVPVILNASSSSSATTSLATQLRQGTCKGAGSGVPIPANAVPAGGTDAHLAVYQPSSNTLWEFWRLSTPANNAPDAGLLPWSGTVSSYGDNQWHAVWGGVMNNVSTSSGVFPNPYGGWTTGLSLLGSVVRIEQLEAGQINQVIAIGGINDPLDENVIPANTPGATDGISWPANRSDGANTNDLALPEGLRFRLPANLNLAQYNLTPVAMAIAVAAQKYGLVIDASGDGGPIGFNLGDPTPYTVAGLPNPYTSGLGVGGVNDGNKGLYDGISGDNQNALLMANFPWDQLQALPFNYGEPSSP